jgi:ATP-dependent Clp protease ATP-binding subunit ClpC
VGALSVAAEMAWKVAAAEAASARHPQIDNAQLLLGLCSLEKLLAVKDEHALAPEAADAVRREAARVEAALARAGLEATPLRHALRERLGRGTSVHGDRPVSRSGPCKETFYRAALLARGSEVTCLHLLAALAQDPDPVVSKPLRELGASLEALKEQALLVARAAPVPAGEKREAPRRAAGDADTPHLDRYGRDLAALAARGETPSLIGRRTEIQQVLQILTRAAKNNAVLVGEPGVGRTSIVQALAAQAAEGKEAVLAGRRIVALVPAALRADAGDGATPGERLERALEDARAHPEVILFVDDLPAVLGTGQTVLPATDLKDPLKAALARVDLRFLAVATPEGYRRHLESDPVLERRFDKVDVEEPTREETLAILRAFVPHWEKRHGVGIDDEALAAAVDLSLRFDHDHRLPRKALEVVDGAAARSRVPLSTPLAAEEEPTRGRAAATGRVTERTVAQVLAERLRLPMELLADALPGAGRSRVLELETHLRARIVGQDEALARVCRHLRRAHSETRERRRPLAVFLFLGPPSVGKTETARLLASHLFGGPEALARFDMSEYAEEGSVVRLVGAPPGYVGHEEEGQLGTRLRTRPYGVVLLDGVEKTHPRVFDLFLKVFDTGELRDGRGRTADARHTVFVMTSSLGTTATAPLEEIRHFFRPELLDRIDEQVVFRSLGPGDAARIVRPLLDDLVETMRREHGVVLTVEPAAEAFIAQAGLDPDRGVGDVGRVVERLVQAPVANLILEGKINRHPAWTVAYDEGGVYVIPAPRG